MPVLEHPVAGGHSDQQAKGEEAVLSQETQTPVDDAPSRQAQTCRPEAADGRNNRDAGQLPWNHVVAARMIIGVVIDPGKTLPRIALQCCRGKPENGRKK